MRQRARGGRKPSNARPTTIIQQKNTDMPFPIPKHILGSEVAALSDTFKVAVIKTAEIVNFCADTKKLGLQRYAPYPPKSLTTSLGRELEKYDHLCDVVESQLLHAVTILRRDIDREKSRLELVSSIVAYSADPLLEVPHESIEKHLPPALNAANQSVEEIMLSTDPNSLSAGSAMASMLSARRPSSISLSSLNRPPFPHKLDLSSVTLRQPLASPVTLAPRTGRPRTAIEGSDFLPELLNALAQEQTVPTVHENMDANMTALQTSTQPGDSADQPIELDLFSPTSAHTNVPQTSAVDSLFTPGASEGIFTPAAPTEPLPATSPGSGTLPQPERNNQSPHASHLFATLASMAQSSNLSPGDSVTLSQKQTTQTQQQDMLAGLAVPNLVGATRQAPLSLSANLSLLSQGFPSTSYSSSLNSNFLHVNPNSNPGTESQGNAAAMGGLSRNSLAFASELFSSSDPDSIKMMEEFLNGGSGSIGGSGAT